MTANKCLVCGSFNFRADRALSGRLVCISCGNPYGVRKTGRNNLNNFNNILFNKRYFLFLSILILALILVLI
tara:strand:+ start:649 stop:864 length:216 start_codon:yes stop_codon:yes gene_type:complete